MPKSPSLSNLKQTDIPTFNPPDNDPSPSAPTQEEFQELPTYDTVVASSSEPSTHPLSGKPLAQHNKNPEVSDTDPASQTSYETETPYNFTVPSHSIVEIDEQEHLLSGQTEYNNRPAPPGYSVYTASANVSRTGTILSRDKHLNNDKEALSQFLYQHNTPPTMFARFYGYHEETRWTTRFSRNSDGEEEIIRDPTTHRVEDFCFKIDFSEYISPNCRGIYVTPDPKTNETKSIRAVCQDYIESKNVLKELKLTKEISWDYDRLTTALTSAIQNGNPFETVEIRFFTEKCEINVKSNHWYSCLMDSFIFKIVLFLTFMWIYILPFNYFYKKLYPKSLVKSDWAMEISEQDWYQAHAQEIITMCRDKLILTDKPSKLHSKLQSPIHTTDMPQNSSFH